MNDNTFDLSGEQRAALVDFAKTFKKAAPNIARTTAVARRIHHEVINAPALNIAEAPKPPAFVQPPPELWSVGHAKVNYVDHIETRQEEQ